MSPPSHPWITQIEPRLYVIRLPSHPRDAPLEAFAEAREAWGRSCDHVHAWLMDMRALESTTAGQRRRFAQHLEAFEPVDVRWNAGTAIVISNAFVRGIATAVFWLKPPKFPNATFAVTGPALNWCRTQLADHPEVP